MNDLFAGKTRYVWEAPNGVTVVSCVPPVGDKWWDTPWKHLPWSWSSWLSWILLELGYPSMRRYLAKRGWWGAPSEKKIAAMQAMKRGRK